MTAETLAHTMDLCAADSEAQIKKNPDGPMKQWYDGRATVYRRCAGWIREELCKDNGQRPPIRQWSASCPACLGTGRGDESGTTCPDCDGEGMVDVQYTPIRQSEPTHASDRAELVIDPNDFHDPQMVHAKP